MTLINIASMISQRAGLLSSAHKEMVKKGEVNKVLAQLGISAVKKPHNFTKEMWNIFDLRFLLGIVSNDLQQTYVRHVSVKDTVLSGFFSSIGLYRHQVTQEMENKTREILDFLEIGHLADRNMTEVSSGEARRVLIARALVHDPKALILDEPTNSLDLHSLNKFQNI